MRWGIRLGAMCWGVCVLGAVLAVGACAKDDSYAIKLSFSTDDLAQDVNAIEMAVTTECPAGAPPLATPSAAVARTLIIQGNTPYPSFKGLAAGRYCLIAIGRQLGDCKVIASGMSPITVRKGGGGTLAVTLAPADGGMCTGDAECDPSTGGCTALCSGDGCDTTDGSVDADCDCPDVEHGTGTCNASNTCELQCDFGYQPCDGDGTACCGFPEDEAIPGAVGGLFAKVAVGPDGTAHVVYTTATTPGGAGAVVYSARRGRSWSPPVQVVSNALVAFDIALDSAGNPLITYVAAANSLWVARWQPATSDFLAEAVGATSYGYKLDVDIDSQDEPQVGWFRGVSTYDGATWTTDDFAAGLVGNIDAAALLGDGDVANGTLTAAPPYYLRVVERVDGVTQTSSDIDTFVTSAGYFPAQLALGGSMLEFVYSNGSAVRYARGRGASWSTPVNIVADDPLTAGHFGLFADGTHTVVSYLDKPEAPAVPHVKYAVRNGNGTFTHRDVAVTTTAAGGTSVVVDAAEGLHLTYYDPVENVPRYVYDPVVLTTP